MQGMNKFKTFLGYRGHKLQVTHINIEGKDKFQLEGSANKVFPQTKFTDPLKSIHGSVDYRLRTDVLIESRDSRVP
jgi:hypothetical protein